MLNELLSALVLGLIGGLIPGPVLTATFTEILQNGFWKSFRIITLAMATETAVALASLIALSALSLPESVFRGLSFFGAGILVWIATSIWKIKKLDTEEKVYFSFWKIAGMILANGVLWTYWITVCIPKAILLNQQLPLGNLIFLLLVEIGWFISTAGVAFIFSRFRKILSHPKAIPVIFKIFALIFVYFAISMVYTSVVFFRK